ncbi:MAG: XamI family restriction endonuclease [Egibacteraceae bacterium]
MAVPAPRWTPDHLESQRQLAVEYFREERMREPLEAYLWVFERYRSAVENLLELTTDLSTIRTAAVEVLTDPALQETARYLTGPPISTDDLKILTEVSLAKTRLQSDPDMARRIIDTILDGLDRNRFPWVGENRGPTEAERQAAVVASAALMASQRMRTARANESSGKQEAQVAETLLSQGFTEVPVRTVNTLAEAPNRGEFCREALCGSRKADLIICLWDNRVMPCECKVSNSSTNSVKRLNNDAAAKAEQWIREFGTMGVIPTAVLSGVYKLHNLLQAQDAGLTLFWAHDLQQLADFIDSTR